MRTAFAAGIAVTLVSCTALLPANELIAVPTQSPGLLFFEVGCPVALLEGTLVADDDAGFVVEPLEGSVSPVIWPHGYVARDTDPRELLDAGTVVARAGDHFSGGGGWLGPTDAAGFTVCGGFDITPAG